MHYFSLHSEDQTHIGFFVMTDDDEHETPPQSGQFLVKLQSENPPPAAAERALAPFQDSETAGIWRLAIDVLPRPSSPPHFGFAIRFVHDTPRDSTNNPRTEFDFDAGS